MKNKNTIPAVDRTLSVLEYLCRVKKAPQAEITSAAGLSATTGYRVMQTLLAHDFVRRDRNGLYVLTLQPLRDFLTGENENDFLKHAQGFLDVLSGKTALSCKLSVRRGMEQLTLLRSEAPGPFSVSGKTGSTFPVAEGSVGAALLAEESEEEIRRICAHLPGELDERKTPSLVLARVAEIRKTGSALLAGKDNRWKVDALSAPVRDAKGKILCAVTLLGIGGELSSGNLAKLRSILLSSIENFEYILKKGE